MTFVLQTDESVLKKKKVSIFLLIKCSIYEAKADLLKSYTKVRRILSKLRVCVCVCMCVYVCEREREREFVCV